MESSVRITLIDPKTKMAVVSILKSIAIRQVLPYLANEGYINTDNVNEQPWDLVFECRDILDPPTKE